MAFDGITTANLAWELERELSGGSIARIIQPGKDELCLTVRKDRKNRFLRLSANPSLPLACLIPAAGKAPPAAPNFCMFLRKHLQNGRLLSVSQPSLDRVLNFSVEHYNELGDLRRLTLVLEMMGKYSNLILLDEGGFVLDSIRRVPSSVSSIREVLPGRRYFIPNSGGKKNPLSERRDAFLSDLFSVNASASEALMKSYTGISIQAAEELCFAAGIDGGAFCGALNETERTALADRFFYLLEDIRAGRFSPTVLFFGETPKEVAAYRILRYPDADVTAFPSMSEALLFFCAERDRETRLRERSAALRHEIKTLLDRTNKKIFLQEKQLADAEKRERYRLYGELLNVYGREAEPNASIFSVIDYHTEQPIDIPLDPRKSAAENAQAYYDRYRKMKRAQEALTVQLAEARADREQLLSCLAMIGLSESTEDISAVRKELRDFGFLRNRTREGTKGKSRPEKCLPHRFRSSDGFLILVGRNNYQNEEVTFRYGNGNDWWFHAKGIPGSHVIVRLEGKEATDRTFEEAASLAAYYSEGRKADKVEVDYTRRKNLHKKNGGRPGFVTYHENFSMIARPDISHIARE